MATWKQQSRVGKPRKFRSAQALLKAIISYFEWIEANPLVESADFHFQGDVVPHNKPLMRAMTITGLCLHIGVTTKCWRQWRSKDNDVDDKGSVDWRYVIDWAESVIWEQKFTGAAAGLLKENIVSRELGLQEQIKNTLDGDVNFEVGLDDATKAYMEAMKGG